MCPENDSCVAAAPRRRRYFARWCLGVLGVGVLLLGVTMLMKFVRAEESGEVILTDVPQRDFSTVSGEHDFWRECLSNHYGEEYYTLMGYFLDEIPKQIDEELLELERQSSSFVLSILAEINGSYFYVTATAKKGDHWEQTVWTQETKWNPEEKKYITTLEKSAGVQFPQVDENAIKTLSENPVTVIHNNVGSCDTPDVHMFVKHSGQSNRIMISDPSQLEEKKWSRTPVASALKSLFYPSSRSDAKEWPRQEFSTLAGERDFWRELLTKYYGKETDASFRDFLDAVPKQLDEELSALSRQSPAFLLIIKSDTDKAIFEVDAITGKGERNDPWEQIQWKLTTKDGVKTMEKSVVRHPEIWYRTIKMLSECSVTLDLGNDADDKNEADDPPRMYIFVRHSGHSCRIAVEDLHQWEEEWSRSKGTSDMKRLWQSVGLLPAESPE